MGCSTLIDCDTLRRSLERPDWVVADCRFDLADPGAGRRGYAAGHVPGAVYVDLETDLSGPPRTDRGRHPLPGPEALRALFSRLGIGVGTKVVAYDDAGGTIAARLWWALRYMGHHEVLVLDGGWQAWCEAGYETDTAQPARGPARFTGEPRGDRLVTLEEVPRAPLLIDARAPARYRGEEEPLDPVAGHIPGARNRFCRDNLDDAGRFRPAGELAREYRALLGDCDAEQAVFYCGSGVSACHDLLAMAHAGLGEGRLYAGSWSEWCADPGRAVETGAPRATP